MSDSSFPARWPDTDPDAITGHNVTPEGAFVPEPARICSIPAAGGLWATAADLVRFGLRWSSLLPEALARKALRPQAAGGRGSATLADCRADRRRLDGARNRAVARARRRHACGRAAGIGVDRRDPARF